jgi:hypothetical protein
MNNLTMSMVVATFIFLPSISIHQNLMAAPNIAKQAALTSKKSICQKTLTTIKSQFDAVKSVKLKPIGSIYGRYPRGQSMVADFNIDNNHPRSENLIGSSAKLLAASQKIARNCSNVGMVQFYIDQTDNGVVYGIVDRQMKQFVCRDALPLKWGEIICP